MIAPAQRLIVVAAVLLLPCALLQAMFPGALPWIAVVLLGGLAVAAVDAARGPARLAEVSATFAPPAEGRGNGNGGKDPVFRFTKEREGVLPVFVHRAKGKALPLRLGLAWPAVFARAEELLDTQCPADTTQLRVDWRCRPVERGRYALDGVYLETRSPLGLWKVRKRCLARAELRVYPSLLSDRRRFASLFLQHGGVGIHAHRTLGKGRDFEKLREYIPGDSYEDIHWKATARRGYPVTKMYQAERTQEVYVVIDASRLSARHAPGANGGASETQLDRFISSAMVLGLAAERQGDLYGLLTFSDEIHGFTRARSGRAHHLACRDLLYTLEPRPVNPNFEELCAFIRLRLRRRALLVFLTNLDDPVLTENFSAQCALLSRRHLVFVNSIVPPSSRPLFEGAPPETPRGVCDALAGHLRWRALRETQRGLRRQGVTLSLLDTEELTGEVLAQYMRVKQRQLL